MMLEVTFRVNHKEHHRIHPRECILGYPFKENDFKTTSFVMRVVDSRAVVSFTDKLLSVGCVSV